MLADFDLFPNLTRRNRAAPGAYKSIEDVTKQDKYTWLSPCFTLGLKNLEVTLGEIDCGHRHERSIDAMSNPSHQKSKGIRRSAL